MKTIKQAKRVSCVLRELFVVLNIDFDDVSCNRNELKATCKALTKIDFVLLKLLCISFQTAYNDLNVN